MEPIVVKAHWSPAALEWHGEVLEQLDWYQDGVRDHTLQCDRLSGSASYKILLRPLVRQYPL